MVGRDAPTTTATAFRGFPPAAFQFYEALDADNTKAFWQANKGTYEDAVRAPMQALCDGLADYGPFHLFRPYNDLRFAKGRPPYKTAQGAVTESESGIGYYVHLSAEGLMAASGWYWMAKDQLQRFRAAVDDEALGSELAALVETAAAAGYTAGAHDVLKTAPRGYARDHPRAELLRRKGLMLSRSWRPAAWMHTAKAAGRVREAWDGADAVNGWLVAHVGTSTLPPEEARRR